MPDVVADNIAVLLVPEPGMLDLLGAGGLGLLLRCRRSGIC
jgi:hypothetical protein